MKEVYFSKIKSTDQIFFTKSDNRVVITDDYIDISTLPYFAYSGRYRVLNIDKSNNAQIILNTEKEPCGGLSFWTIYISKTRKRVMLYNDRKEGIILK